MKKEEFLKNIRNLKEVYIINSNSTKSPFVQTDEDSNDISLFFLDETSVKDKIKNLNKENENVSYIKVENKFLANAINTLLMFGINAIKIHVKEDEFTYQISEILDIKEENKVFRNPILSLTMLYFFQEFRKKERTIDVDSLKELEEEMLVNVTRAKYLIPVSKDNSASFMLLKLKDGGTSVPIFTDHMEINRFVKSNDFDLKIIGFKEMIDLILPEDCNSYVINPSGAALLVMKDWVYKFKK